MLRGLLWCSGVMRCMLCVIVVGCWLRLCVCNMKRFWLVFVVRISRLWWWRFGLCRWGC